MRTMVAIMVMVALVVASTPARADIDGAFEVGGLSRGTAGGDLTVGFSATGTRRLNSFLLYGFRAALLGTGFAAASPGILARLNADLGVSMGDVRLDVGAGADFLSHRSCGARYCGRITGLVPAASARLIYYTPLANGAVGASLTGDVLYVSGSQVFNGLSWTVTIGPVWRFDAKETKK